MRISVVLGKCLEDDAEGNYATLCLQNVDDDAIERINSFIESGVDLPYEILAESNIYMKVDGGEVIYSAPYGLECVLVAVAEYIRSNTKGEVIVPITGPLAELWCSKKPFKDFVVVDSALAMAIAEALSSYAAQRGVVWYRVPTHSYGVAAWAHVKSIGIQCVEGDYVLHILYSNLGDYNRGKFLTMLGNHLVKKLPNNPEISRLRLGT